MGRSSPPSRDESRAKKKSAHNVGCAGAMLENGPDTLQVPQGVSVPKVEPTFHAKARHGPEESSLTMYLNEIGKYERITPEQEMQLAQRIQQGDAKARELMIRANLKLVVKIAHDYSHFGVPILDLIAEGNMGLMKAVERFDPTRGGKLSTYASWWIKQAIKRALTNQGKTIRIPVHMVERVARIRKAKYSLEAELGREPTAEEIAIEVKMPVNKVAHLISISVRPASLYAPINEDDSAALGELIGDDSATTPAEDLHSKSMSNDLHTFIANLDDREREILKLRFGLGGSPEQTLEEIGDKLNITRERVRQIQDELLAKLRASLIEREEQHSSKDIQKEALAVAYHKAIQSYMAERRNARQQTHVPQVMPTSSR